MPISVIIPSYNRSALLSSAIQSVLEQTLPVEEIIVLDDGSTDGTRQNVQTQFADIYGDSLKYIFSEQNKGVSAARNRGIELAQGDWIAFLDSDDLWLPEKLGRQFSVIGDSKWVHGQERWIRNGIEIQQMAKHLKEAGDIFERSLKLCVVSPSSVVIHRSLFEKYGVFDETLPVCEDFDLWLRFAAYEPIAFSEDVGVIKNGGHQDQLSRKYKAMDFWRVQAMLKQVELEVHSLERKRLIWSQIAYKSSILLRGYLRHSNYAHYKQVFQCRQRAYRHLGQTGYFG